MNKQTIIEEILGNFRVPEGHTQEEIWDKIDSKIKSDNSSSKTKSFIQKILPFGVAASLALAFLFVWNDNSTSFTSNLEYKTIDLPDGSTVDLGPHSTLEFLFEENSRTIKLEGSAYFNVVKGKPFTVQSTNCEVTVLGTSFKVNDFKNNFDVKCYTGLVQVAAQNEIRKLTAGKGVNSSNNLAVYSHNQKYLEVKNSLDYQNEYLSTLITDLELKKNLVIRNNTSVNPIVNYTIQDESNVEIVNTLATISGLTPLKIDENTFELN